MPKPVLVVEDDEDSCTALVEFLLFDGIRAVGAANGAAAIDLIQEGLLPCLIVLDLLMPIFSGEQFLKARRLSPELARVPVLVITGRDIAPEEFTDMNVKAVFRKPLDYKQIIEAIRTFHDGPAN